MTFNQATKLNAHVRKGEKGSLVVYANSFKRVEQDAEGQDVEREISFLKGCTVFNVDQIEGLAEPYYGKPEPKFAPVERIDVVSWYRSARASISLNVCSATCSASTCARRLASWRA